jgi:hypothetical protein
MQSITRREFHGHLVRGAMGLALAGTSLSLDGCNAWDELAEWVPVGLAAFNGLASIVDGPFTAVATTVNALWAAVANAVSLYQHTTDPTNTTLDKVIAAMDALAGGLDQAIDALPVSIPAAVLSAAKLGISLLISTLKAIQAKIEPPATTTSALAVRAHAAITHAVTVAPAKSRRDFISKFNAIMAANGQALRVR